MTLPKSKDDVAGFFKRHVEEKTRAGKTRKEAEDSAKAAIVVCTRTGHLNTQSALDFLRAFETALDAGQTQDSRDADTLEARRRSKAEATEDDLVQTIAQTEGVSISTARRLAAERFPEVSAC